MQTRATMVSIKQDVANRSESVERIYGFNVDDRFLVNRRYQRKLVWSIDEKRAFIDSIRRGFPVPLILLADVEHNGADRFEIIDGMQRLDSLVSFVEGEFDLDGQYFDLQAMAQTKLLLDQGLLTQKTPALPRETCVKIVGYSLPLTVYPAASASEIDEIFRRINAYGKHLSRQELRVAGVTSSFAQLVRTLAARIRGDVSVGDRLYLRSMKQISITSKDLPYGLNVDTLFWVQNSILTREYIRQSRDEELIADMLGYALLTPKLSSSAEVIDEFFGYSPAGGPQARRDEIEAAISKIGHELIAAQFLAVHQLVRDIIHASGKRFSELMFEDAGQRVPRYFQTVFLAIWELIVTDQLVIKDFKRAARVLNGAGKHMSIGAGGGRFSAEDREKNVNVVKGLLRPACAKRKSSDPALSSWTTEFENILMQSHTEQALYDFKQGFRVLDESKAFDEGAIEKAFKTLAAMANHGPGATGYVIVGVADDAATAKRVEALHGVKPLRFQRFLITGIDHEAIGLPKGLDSYFSHVNQRLARVDMSTWTRDQIARDVRLIRYYDRSLLIFTVEAGKEPCAFQGKYYERHGANVEEVLQPGYAELFRRFLGVTPS